MKLAEAKNEFQKHVVGHVFDQQGNFQQLISFNTGTCNTRRCGTKAEPSSKTERVENWCANQKHNQVHGCQLLTKVASFCLYKNKSYDMTKNYLGDFFKIAAF